MLALFLYLKMIEDINETRLDNGLSILTDQMQNVRSVTLGFFFRVGARHEPATLHGISHFIEHTVFKGTHRRSAMDIAVEQDRLGGNLDAFTTHEETGFAVKVIDEQLVNAFDLMADILLHPRFDAADLESEQRVIIEEMKMIDDSPEEYLGELFNEAFFAGHPLGRSITGTPETVKTFNNETTRAYHAETFVPANLVIAAAGNVEHQQLVDLARRFLNFQSAPASGQFGPRSASPEMNAPILIKNRQNLEQAHLVLATPFVSAIDPRRYAGEMLANIIGGGTSSRLWQKVREQRGLVYNIGSSSIAYQDCGLFSVFAGTSPGQVPEVVELVMKELRDVAKNGVSSEELDLAKQQAVSSILLSLEDSASRAAAIAQSEMVHGRQISAEETIAKVQEVTLADVRGMASEHFITDAVAFAALGDLKGLRVTREDLQI